MRPAAFSALAALLLAAATHAQEAKQPSAGPPKAPPTPETVFQRLDTNRDGVITADELPLPLRQRLGDRFTEADKDGNKKLDSSEFAALWKEWPHRGPLGRFGRPGGPAGFADKGPAGKFGFGPPGPQGFPAGPAFGPPPGRPLGPPPDAQPPSHTGPKGSCPADSPGASPTTKGPVGRQGDSLRAIFKRLDRDGNGQLSYEEFAAGASRLLRGPAGLGPFGTAAFGPPFGSPAPGRFAVGPVPFGPPRLGYPGFGLPAFGPPPPRPFGPPGLGPASFSRPRAAWWHRGVWPGIRHAMLPAMFARPRGPLGWTASGMWAPLGSFGPRGLGAVWHKGPPPWAGAGASGLMARFDTDRDGKLSRTEAPQRLAERFDSIDRNRDGFLTPDEIRAAAARQAFNFPKQGPWPAEKPPKPKPPEKSKDKPLPDKLKDRPPKDKPPVGA